MVDPWTYFIVEEIIFPEESGGVTGEGLIQQESQGLDVEPLSPVALPSSMHGETAADPDRQEERQSRADAKAVKRARRRIARKG